MNLKESKKEFRAQSYGYHCQRWCPATPLTAQLFPVKVCTPGFSFERNMKYQLIARCVVAQAFRLSTWDADIGGSL